MADVIIRITDTGNDNLVASCSDPLVNAVLLGKAAAIGLTGAQQLAVFMSHAARQQLAQMQVTQAKRRFKMHPEQTHH